MATSELVPFSPQWTQGIPGGSSILDQNLAKIKAALDAANATIIRIDNDVTRVITSVNITVAPSAQAPIDAEATEDTGGGGYPVPPSTVMARFWVSTADPSYPFAVNIGALSPSGVMQVAISAGVATPSTFGVTAGRIPHGSGTNGGLTDSANLTYSGGTLTVTGIAPMVIGNGAAGVKTQFRDPDSLANFAQVVMYPASGTNVTSFLGVSARGTGASSTNRAQLLVFNTDFPADTANYEIGGFRAAGSSGIILATGKNGTGANRQLMLAAGWFTDGVTNNNQLLLNTDGSVDMNSLNAGGLVRAANGSGKLSVFSVGVNRVPFGAAGGVLTDSADMTFAGGVFQLGTGTNSTQLRTIATGSAAAIVNLWKDAGASKAVSFGNGVSGSAPTDDAIIATFNGAAWSERLRVATASGVVTIATLGSGIVKATSGALSIASAGTDYQGVITWPAVDRVLVSSGTTSAPVGFQGFEYDTGSDEVSLSNSVPLAIYNLGSRGASANFERGRLRWTGNTLTLNTEANGSGVVRPITVNAGTATLTLRANSTDVHGVAGVGVGLLAGVRSTPQVTIGATTSVTIAAGVTGPNPSASFAATQLTLDASVPSKAVAGAVVWDGLKITGASALTGAGTATAPYSATTFAIPVITGSGGGATVNEAATVAITGGPTASAITINLKMALWVQADPARFDGGIIMPTVANGAVATVLGSLGPAGSHTTVQAWLKIQDTSLTNYYIPMF